MVVAAERDAIRRVVSRVAPGGRLLRAWRLQGGVSAQLTAFEIALPGGGTERLVLRRHGAADLAANPDVAADEFRLLKALLAVGLAVPAPRHLDRSCTVYPVPYLVLEYVHGETTPASADTRACVRELAAYLARIHGVGAGGAFAFLPRLGKGFGDPPVVLDDSLQEGRIRDVLVRLWPLPGLNADTLLHGDYWPGNVLWHGGEIAAVIDWEDAALGDPLADLGNGRLEVLWAFGSEGMERFTAHYRLHQPQLDYQNLPYWDLCAALRPASKLGEWGLDAATEGEMRERHRWFVGKAMARLG